jgi:diguanylate cyclase (GGDEF)-like protein
MIVKNLNELDTFMPYLISSPDGEEVFYAVSSGEDFGSHPFEYLCGNEASLALPNKEPTFDFLLSSRNNFLNLEKFFGKSEIYHSIRLLEKKRGTFCFEFPFVSGSKRSLFACSVYSWPEKEAYIVCLRRLKLLEKYLSEYSDKTSHDFTTALLNKESCLSAVNAIKSTDHIMLIFTDLNNFKLVNDVYGHIMGDKILRAFANCLVEAKPQNAHIYRFGGDEFIGILSDFDEQKTADWLKGREEAFLNGGNFGLPVSFSAGCCQMSPSFKAPLYLIRCADKAMYMAKKKDVPFYILTEKEALKIIEDDQKNNG